MLVRLTTKLAELVNGLDLSHCREGDVVAVAEPDAAMLIAEGWATPAEDGDRVSCHAKHVVRAVAEDDGYLGWRKAPRRYWREHRFNVTLPMSPEHEP